MKKHIASMLTVMLMLSFAACENASDEISVQTDPHATESNSINITEETAQAAEEACEYRQLQESPVHNQRGGRGPGVHPLRRGAAPLPLPVLRAGAGGGQITF